jgi:23S rRNA (cytosine1962-C5)-methyltransferase
MISLIVLQAGREVSVRRFHPWVFSGAISRYEGDLADGDTVGVYDHKKNYLGTGHYHNGSIAVRLFSFTNDPDRTSSDSSASDQPLLPDVAYWTRKLSRIRAIRQTVVSQRQGITNCYRLVHGEGDGCTGLVIDIYNGVAVFQAHSIGMHRERQHIADALQAVFADALIAVYDKSVESLPTATRPTDYASDVVNSYLFGQATVPHPVLENGHTFLIDWITGQKTGFFLDQRDNRALLGRYAAGKRVLNAFCYSGGFSVYALAAGASLVHSVDVSKKAIDLTEQNLAANFPDEDFAQTGRHRAFAEDVMPFLKTAAEAYDIVVLDPPAFAKSLSARHRAVQGYKRLNAEGLRRVAPGGLLFTFSCSQVVDRDLFYNTVVAAAIEAGRAVRVLHQLSQPADHPVSLFHPEGSYLKGLVLWVD